MWGSRLLTSMIAEEISTSPLFLSSLKAVVRSICHFNVITACHLLSLMAGTTLQWRDCVLRSVVSHIRDQEKSALRSSSFFSDRPIDGQAKPVPAYLEDSAQDFSLQKSIWAMAAGTHQLAKSSFPPMQQKPSFREWGLPESTKVRILLPREPSVSSLRATTLSLNHNSPLSTNQQSPPQEATAPSPLAHQPAEDENSIQSS